MDENIQKLVGTVYERANTIMGEYWVRFMKISNILLQNVDACHAGNLDGYLSCNRTMLSGMQAYNNHDYGK